MAMQIKVTAGSLCRYGCLVALSLSRQRLVLCMQITLIVKI